MTVFKGFFKLLLFAVLAAGGVFTGCDDSDEKDAKDYPIIINEVSANGSDYIELYNSSSSSYTLEAADWSLKSENKMDAEFVFPAADVVVPANGFVLVICPPDIDDTGVQEDWELPTISNDIANVPSTTIVIQSPGENKQTGADPDDKISLDDSGDTITLKKGASTVQELTIPSIAEGDPEGSISYGRYPDGEILSENLESTPGSANQEQD